MINWTEEQIIYLKENIDLYGIRACSKQLQISPPTVRKKLIELGLRDKNHFWTKEEDEILIKNYELKTLDELTQLLPNRTIGSIQGRVFRLNLKCGKAVKLNGKQFDKLKVIELDGIYNHHAYYHCICSCGKRKSISGTSLISGKVKSCGCIRFKNPTYRYITGNEFSAVRTRARLRKKEFSITISDIDNLYQKQNGKCALTGINIVFNTCKKLGTSKIIRGNASVDRKDSSKGYTVDNIQLIDKDVNFAKQAKSDEDFIKMCELVVNFNRKKNNDECN